MVQAPAASNVTCAPLMVHTAGVSELYISGRFDELLPLKVSGDSFTRRLDNAPNEMLCASAPSAVNPQLRGESYAEPAVQNVSSPPKSR